MLQMCICEFCHTDYAPRPQVKKPRACTKCQALRQAANEKSWKDKNVGLYDSEYHRVRRNGRMKRLRSKVEGWIRCMEVGGTLLGVSTFQTETRSELAAAFLKFLSRLGITHANKFWPLEIASDSASF
jgi:hypothetical protein